MSLVENITDVVNAIGNDIRSLKSGQVFSRYYESAEMFARPKDYYELEHGFGMMPRLLMLTLKCVVADEFGYEVGEEISLDQVYTGISYGTDVGIQSANSSTKIRIKVATDGAAVTSINTGQPGLINPYNYRLIVRAWA